MDPIQYHQPPPKDSLDRGEAGLDKVDDVLGTRHEERDDTAPRSPSGDITNPDTQHQENAVERDEVDPFRE